MTSVYIDHNGVMIHSTQVGQGIVSTIKYVASSLAGSEQDLTADEHSMHVGVFTAVADIVCGCFPSRAQPVECTFGTVPVRAQSQNFPSF